jgi:hypothetical protein
LVPSFRLMVLAGSFALPVLLSAPAQAQQPPAQGWDNFPPMILEQVFRAPLRDTIIQRWRDPANSIICYLYVPISTPFSQAQPGIGFVQYGANTIGSISCVNPTQLVQLAPTPQPQPAPEAARPGQPAPPRPATPPATPPATR